MGPIRTKILEIWNIGRSRLLARVLRTKACKFQWQFVYAVEPIWVVVQFTSLLEG